MSNCLFFVLHRWFTRGGYLISRKSHHGWWPHFVWSPDLKTFEEFLPIAGGRKRLIPPPLFRGYIKSSQHQQLRKSA